MKFLFFYLCIMINGFVLQAHISSLELHHGSNSPIAWYGVVDKKDLSITAAISATLCGGSFLVKDKNVRTGIQVMAVLVPLVRFLSTMGIVKKTLNNIPVVKEVFGCSAQECEGICGECVMRNVMIDEGIGALSLICIKPAVESMVKRYAERKKERLEKEEREKEEVAELSKDCPICTEDMPQNKDDYKLMPCCENKNWICNGCINNCVGTANLSRGDDVPSSFFPCPLCRQIVDPYTQTRKDFKKDNKIDKKEEALEETSKIDKKEDFLCNSPATPFFNKLFLVGGAVVAGTSTAFSYADHRPMIKDAGITVACCGALIACAAKVQDPVMKKLLLAEALVIPFIGLVNRSEMIRNIGKSIPLLNHVFGCENKKCTTICAHCKLRNAMRGTAISLGAITAYSYVCGGS